MRKNRHNFFNDKQKTAFCSFFALFVAFFASSQALNARYLEYIDRYKAIALEHQRDFGVPAAITLAQGLLESNAGQSYLARRGNNHFGIKCYSWKGPVVEYDDTLKHNCYRNYGCAEDSFLDHAKFLKGKRYSALYDLDVTDYQGWAQGLRDCGYAEDPAYPQKLVRLIEQYELNLLAPDVANKPLPEKGVVPPRPSRKSDVAQTEVPPRPARQRRVTERQRVPEPSRAQIDQRVARNRPARDRSRAVSITTGTASADND